MVVKVKMNSTPFDKVVLIHGIRTQAGWAEMVASLLREKCNLTVTPIRYGYFDVFRFLIPGSTRSRPVEIVSRELRSILRKNQPERVLVIAHSFGTYIVSKLLSENPDITIGGLILCGSVISEDFRWDINHRSVHLSRIVNDCGERDIFPNLAKSFSWGYGATGRQGFGVDSVRDRFHDLGHSGFFEREFVIKYWIPLAEKWSVLESDYEKNRGPGPWWVGIAEVFPAKTLFAVGLLFLFKEKPLELANSANDKLRATANQADVGSKLAEVKKELADMKNKSEVMEARLNAIRELSPIQEQTLAQVKTSDPGKLTGKGKFWIPGANIRIGFIGGTPTQKNQVKQIAQEWLKYANLTFTFTDFSSSDVRVAFDGNGGAWSYLGTDALGLAKSQPTMNLAWTDRASVLHEFGHVLGLIDEHLNPNDGIKWNKALVRKELGGPPNSWSEETLQERVFKVVPKNSLGDYRSFDPKSVMAYPFDARLTGGVSVGGGSDLSESDKKLVAMLYPK
jgi:pimeloyl-ACP methyl ester carboxylesterase